MFTEASGAVMPTPAYQCTRPRSPRYQPFAQGLPDRAKADHSLSSIRAKPQSISARTCGLMLTRPRNTGVPTVKDELVSDERERARVAPAEKRGGAEGSATIRATAEGM